MENPATWNAATKTIDAAIKNWHEQQKKGVYGLSLAQTIHNALKDRGHLRDYSK